MTSRVMMSNDRRTLIVRVPLSLKKRGGRKLVIAAEGAPWTPPSARVDNTMVKAVARGFRWRKLLETGVHATVEDIAVAEMINPSYVSRVLRLTLLAPTVVDAMLNGGQGPEITLAALMKPFPGDWREQLKLFGFTT